MLVIALLPAVLCGCGKEKTLTITLRTMSTLGAGAEYDIYSSLIAEFSAAHPDIYIRDTSAAAADSYRLGAAKESTYTSADAPHVVYYTAEGGLSSLSEYFVPLDEIRDIYPDFASGISPGALEGFRLADGGIYCVPVMGEWSGIVINRAVFIENAVEVPTDWSSLLTAAGQLSANGVIPFANSADDCAAMLEALVTAYGSDDAAALGLEGYSNIIDPYWQLALADMAQLFRMGAFAPAALTADIEKELLDSAPTPEPVSSGDVSASDAQPDATPEELFCGHPLSSFPQLYDALLGSDRDRSVRTDAAQLFDSGKAAMIIIDSAEFSDINYTDGCSVIPFPSPLDDFSEVLTGGFRSGFAITRRAFADPAVRDAAVAFVDMMTSQKAVGQFASLGYLPADLGEGASYPGAVGSLLSSSYSDSCFLTTCTGAAAADWNSINKMCARLYYQLITPSYICSQLSDPELVWSFDIPDGDGSESPETDTEAVSQSDIPSE